MLRHCIDYLFGTSRKKASAFPMARPKRKRQPLLRPVFASFKIHWRECLVDIEKAVKKDFLRPESLAVILG